MFLFCLFWWKPPGEYDPSWLHGAAFADLICFTGGCSTVLAAHGDTSNCHTYAWLCDTCIHFSNQVLFVQKKKDLDAGDRGQCYAGFVLLNVSGMCWRALSLRSPKHLAFGYCTVFFLTNPTRSGAYWWGKETVDMGSHWSIDYTEKGADVIIASKRFITLLEPIIAKAMTLVFILFLSGYWSIYITRASLLIIWKSDHQSPSVLLII